MAGLDFGGSAVKACVVDIASGELLAAAERATETRRPAPGRAEFDPAAWWMAASEAMADAVAHARRPASDYAAVTATSLRQGYVLVGAEAELGFGVLNSDRRGAAHLDHVRSTIGVERLYDVTGHWSAPQLTLPKLLDEQRSDPARWRRTETVLFVHDWALWRLSGVRVSEPSMASAGQLLDVRRRVWATEVLGGVGLDAAVLPPLADPGTTVGELRDGGLGLPTGVPVVVGGGDTQMAAAGAGGMTPGVVSVVAGTTTPLLVTTAEPPTDPRRHPWISAHLSADRWTAETNAGYTGMSFDWLAAIVGVEVAALAKEASGSEPGAAGITAAVTAPLWSEESWSQRAPSALLGFEPGHRRADVARAFIEAHAYGIRGNLEDLERAIGARAGHVTMLGGAARSDDFAQLVADVIGRPLRRSSSGYPAARAFAWLAAHASGEDALPPTFAGDELEPTRDARYDDGYRRYVDASEAVRGRLAGWTA